MYRISLTGLALITAAACAPQETTQTLNRSDFAVIRGGVDIDALMAQCVDDPQAAGFPSSQECFQHARKLMSEG